MTPRFRLPLFILVGLAAALTATMPVWDAAAPAQAHNNLVSSTPREGETLTALPKDFVITTNGSLLNIEGNSSGFGLQVTDSAGKYYGDGCVTVDGSAVSTAAALGVAGAYTVTWQAVSTDGHTISDSFSFTWQPPASFTPSPGSAKVPDCNGTTGANVQPAPDSGTTGTQTVGAGTLTTVLGIGGAFLAAAAVVILALVFAGRRKKTP